MNKRLLLANPFAYSLRFIQALEILKSIIIDSEISHPTYAVHYCYPMDYPTGGWALIIPITFLPANTDKILCFDAEQIILNIFVCEKFYQEETFGKLFLEMTR